MNAITHFFQPPAYVFFILLDFWGHRFAAFQKTAEIDFELRGRHVGKPHYVLRVRKICVRPTTAKHLFTQAKKSGPGIALSNRKITIQRISIRETNCVVHRVEIYPVDSVIWVSNNWAQRSEVCPRKNAEILFFLLLVFELHDKRPRKSTNKVVYVLNKIKNKPNQTMKISKDHIGSF